MRLARGARTRRGFALIDFVTGTAIFAGAVLAFAGLTRTKFEVLHQAGTLQRAQSDLEARLDALRREGLLEEPSGAADPRGFQVVRREEVQIPGIGSATRVVAARPLVVLEGSARRVEPTLLEVQVSLTWAEGVLHLSTVMARGGPK